MKPARFQYECPSDVGAVIDLLDEDGVRSKILAGGQSLVPLLALRRSSYDRIIDINRIAPLSGVAEIDGRLRIGSMTRQTKVEHAPVVGRLVPLLAEAVGYVGHQATRNRGTIGGSIAYADPAAELPAVALALGAEMEVISAAGSRRIPTDALLSSAFTTTLRSNELITGITYPAQSPRTGCAIVEVNRRHGETALVGAVAVTRLDESGVVASAQVVVFGTKDRPVSVEELGRSVEGKAPSLAGIDAVILEAIQGIAFASDVHAGSAYRHRVAGVVVKRALQRAIQRAWQKTGDGG
jgi:CO/xanthine dehydrogenase FAD-binding subunit